MSSMWRVAAIFPVMLAMTPGSSSAQYASPTYVSAPAYAPTVASSIQTWRTLRQSSGYRFSDYANFLIANPDWPDESRMRGWAEKAMQPGENAATVIAFFASDKPRTGNGWARLAEALSSTAQAGPALDAARQAWRSPDLSATDEQAIWARFGGNFTRADNDNRVDELLFAKKPDAALRYLTATSPERQAAFGARIAMQQNAADADARYAAVIGSVTQDAGLMMDRARWLRANNFSAAAQQLAARDHQFTLKPADPERFYDMLIQLAGDAVADRNWQTAYNIASQIDDALPAGADMAKQPLGVRDDYTTLAWLAGTVALDRMNRPSSAVAMFDRYARGGRSLQVSTKGNYWAGRASLGAGRYAEANAYFARAAAYPELFYGQLALERLGRSVTPPPAALPQYVTTQLQRTAFNSRRLVQAIRLLQNSANEQALFVRALAESLENDTDRNLAVDLGQQIGRQDIAVWTARMARVKGSAFYVRQAYPILPGNVSGELWSLAHGISRQESSFDPYVTSHAGARGMMQLMTGTAREQAGKMGIAYDGYRLISDPAYNVSIGASYFQRMLNIWNGNVPLAVASYNAGSGNAGKWVRQYGDPRSQVDVLKWIEAIPFSETRAYVQRVIENSVVYDSMRPQQPQQSAMHVSRYLGKDRPG
ncbi:lytic transglycosylase domain-containing protein [Sphingomonas flavescens]|uniref:lytic transglycosylase domain-containing protein n=1 Tax=Sphingomonas flavescens TaxID=3132797 RepID=UPI0028055E6E|nr:lytic transglycosylase domain-containing protein [Sphingomonas limnosediminicola]